MLPKFQLVSCTLELLSFKTREFSIFETHPRILWPNALSFCQNLSYFRNVRRQSQQCIAVVLAIKKKVWKVKERKKKHSIFRVFPWTSKILMKWWAWLGPKTTPPPVGNHSIFRAGYFRLLAYDIQFVCAKLAAGYVCLMNNLMADQLFFFIGNPFLYPGFSHQIFTNERV